MSKLENANTIIAIAASMIAAGIAIGYAKAKVESLNPRNIAEMVLNEISPQIILAKSQVPVGSVVAVWLDSDRISKLAPIWQIANGDTCQVTNSPFFSKKLPDLMGRYILGGQVQDVTSSDASLNQGGSWEIALSGTTAGADHQNYQQRSIKWIPYHERGGKFIVDTDTNEEAWSEHNHHVTVSGRNPGTPHRKLTYLIKVL